MDRIADSNALKDDNRLLPQHQVALTLLQSLLTDPKTAKVCWLDLACGRGQMIGQLDQNLSKKARSKLVYYGYDVDQDFARQASKAVTAMRLKTAEIKIGELADFSKLYDPKTRFDFITIINTIHEISPNQLARIFIHCLTRLSPIGCLFVYDLETVGPIELGAITWTQEEMSSIIWSLCKDLGSDNYEPDVSRWRHRTTKAWSFSIHRAHLNIDQDSLILNRDYAAGRTNAAIKSLLTKKLERCRRTLESLTLHGCETAEEEEERERLLYDFWALSRVAEVERK